MMDLLTDITISPFIAGIILYLMEDWCKTILKQSIIKKVKTTTDFCREKWLSFKKFIK